MKRLTVLVSLVALSSLALASPVRAATLDQSQELSASPSCYAPHSIASNCATGVAQTFTAGLSGELSLIELELQRSAFAPTTEAMSVEIRAGGPTGAVLATASVEAASIPLQPTFAWIQVPFESPATVNAGDTYAIVLPPGPFTETTDPTYRWTITFDDVYADGVAWDHGDDSGVWRSYLFGSDRTFRTYVEVQNRTPIGTHDAFEGEAGPFFCAAAGWAVDPDDRFADLNVRILSDGIEVASGVANLFRQDLLDAGVSPDGISAFHINLWGLVSLNVPHLITAQAQDAQTAEWADLNLTPKSLTCVASTAESPNPKLAFFTADCLISGTVFVESVFFANDNPDGGSTSAFHVIGENTTFIIYTGGTDMNADDLCLFGWTGGWEPKPPWNSTFLANVFVTPKN